MQRGRERAGRMLEKPGSPLEATAPAHIMACNLLPGDQGREINPHKPPHPHPAPPRTPRPPCLEGQCHLVEVIPQWQKWPHPSLALWATAWASHVCCAGAQVGLGQCQALLLWGPWGSPRPSLCLGYLGGRHRAPRNTLLSPWALHHLIPSHPEGQSLPHQAVSLSPLNWPGQVAGTPPHPTLSLAQG